MSYVDGFLIPVPKRNKAAYKRSPTSLHPDETGAWVGKLYS